MKPEVVFLLFVLVLGTHALAYLSGWMKCHRQYVKKGDDS